MIIDANCLHRHRSQQSFRDQLLDNLLGFRWANHKWRLKAEQWSEGGHFLAKTAGSRRPGLAGWGNGMIVSNDLRSAMDVEIVDQSPEPDRTV